MVVVYIGIDGRVFYSLPPVFISQTVQLQGVRRRLPPYPPWIYVALASDLPSALPSS